MDSSIVSFFLLSSTEWTILVVFSVIILGLAIAYRIWLNHRIEIAQDCLRRQAEKRQGRISDERLTFNHHDIEITVGRGIGIDPEDSSSFLYATFQTNIFPERTLKILSHKVRSVADRVFGSAHWDFLDGYSIYSNDETFMTALLTKEFQKDLLSYDRGLEIVFGKPGIRERFGTAPSSMLVKHSPGLFFLSLYKTALEDADFDAVIATTIKFYERLKSVSDQAGALEAQK